MKQLITLTTTLLLATATTAQPECKIISFDHFGGNKSDNIMFTGQQPHEPADEFVFYISTLSTEGEIYIGCTAEIGGGTVIRKYSGDYSSLISENCAPKGIGFLHETTFFYLQPNGDTVIIGAVPDDFGSNDMAIERRSPTGEVLWSKHYGGSGAEAASKVAIASDGTFLVLTGTTSDDGDVGFHYGSEFDGDMWLVKLDTFGNLLWGKVLGGTSFDLLSTVIPDSDGGCYLFGATVSTDHDATGSHGNTDLWIVKLDGGGNKEWHKMLGGSLTDGSGYDNGVRAIRDSGSGFYVLARTDSHDGDVQQRMPIGQEDLWLLHVDSVANILWENTYGGPQLQASSALCRGADGSIWMAGTLEGDSVGGHINANYFTTDGWIVHADSLGNFLNQRTIGANKEEQVIVLQPLTDGTILAAGRYLSSINSELPKTPGFPETGEGDSDVFVVRLSPDNDLGIEDHNVEDRSWTIYPNPSDKAVTINFHNAYGDYEVAIYDAGGRAIIAGKKMTSSSLTLSTAGLPPGTYTVQLKNAAGHTTGKKLVIRH